MSQLPAMPVWWADFFTKTDHLSNAEQWAYAKLMAKTWLRNCRPLPDNAADLARALGMTVKRWLLIRPRIAPFFDLSEGTWRQLRLEEEFVFVSKRADISRRNGTQGGRPKSNNIKDIKNPAGLQNETQEEPTYTHTQKEEKGSLSGAQKAEPKRKQQVPVDWWPNEKGVALAEERAGWIGQRLSDEVEQFRDRHRGLGHTFLDVEAAWRTWVRNGMKFQTQRRSSNVRAGAVDNLVEGFGRAAGLRRGSDAGLSDWPAADPLLDGEHVGYDA